jgi:2-dehydro-3-deoxyphosphogluconate aldolase/(4S)-4-hydroxy-2-oxoglutarate aldolase
MDKQELFSRMLSDGLIPLIRASSPAEAIEVAGAIKKGCAGFLEITMTIPGGIEVIRELKRQIGDDIIIGAGTVLDSETGRSALLAGAQFLVSPTIHLGLIQLAHRYNVVVIPGAMTPTEILTAWEAGADLVKVFPAGLLGGPEYLKALKGPLPQILLMPSGGISLDNVGSFIRAGASVVAVGGELVEARAVREKKFDRITENTRAFITAIEKARRGL